MRADGAQLLADQDARIKRHRSAFERFERHCAGNICDPCETLGAEEREATDGVHRLRAVEQREPFLGAKFARLKTRLFQSLRAGHAFAFGKGFPFPE